MTNKNGLILWQGASLIDGAPIVVIATGMQKSKKANRKTGNMVQTYILRSDVSPTDAIKLGLDVSICADCPYRGDGTGKARRCYVNVGNGPLQVWKAFQRGAYPVSSANLLEAAEALRSRVVRFGSYRDPAAAPAHIWQTIADVATATTGYTHQWRKAPALRTLCMASADSAQDAIDAQAMEWRSFRVAHPGQLLKLSREAICPASAEAGKKLTCELCRACNGAQGRKGSIVIQAHGGFAVMANVKKFAQNVHMRA